MATTGQLIAWLAGSGARDSSGAVVASGKARFYSPGTTTAITAYSDSAGSSTITQPLTLDSGGRGTAYVRVACRVVVKDSTDTTTILDLDPANVTRAEQVYITNDNVNSGTETTLNDYFTNNSLTYKEGDNATSRTIKTWMQESKILGSDYGMAGDDSTDDTTELQALIDRGLAASRTGSGTADTCVLELPIGTWKINGAVTAAVASGIKQLIIRGQGPKQTIIKQYGTAVDTLYLNYTSSTSCRTLIEEIGITASTTTSGNGIRSTNGNKVTVRRCEVGLHRTGMNLASATDCLIEDSEVVSTDGNSAAVGISVGARSRIRDCIVTGSSSLGTGISSSAADVRVRDCDVSGFLNQIALSGARSRVSEANVTNVAAGTGIGFTGANSRSSNCYVVGVASTDTGISLGAANCDSVGDHVTGCATGVSIGAVARCRIASDVSGNTTNVSINASATDHIVGGHTTAGAGLIPQRHLENRAALVDGGSVTPLAHGGHMVWNVYRATGAIASQTIAATSTTDLVTGCMMAIFITTLGGAYVVTSTFNAQYDDETGTDLGVESTASAAHLGYIFTWTGSAWRVVWRSYKA